MESIIPSCCNFTKTNNIFASTSTCRWIDRHNDLLCIPIYWDAPVEVSAIAYEVNLLESCRLVFATSLATAGRTAAVEAFVNAEGVLQLIVGVEVRIISSLKCSISLITLELNEEFCILQFCVIASAKSVRSYINSCNTICVGCSFNTFTNNFVPIAQFN